MSDRLNINEPWSDRDWRQIEESEIAAVKISVRDRRIMDLEAQLSSIFNRVAGGQRVELHYHSGDVVPIVAAPAGEVDQ